MSGVLLEPVEFRAKGFEALVGALGCEIRTVLLSRVATDGPTLIGALDSQSIGRVEVGRPVLRMANRKAPCDLGMSQSRARIG